MKISQVLIEAGKEKNQPLGEGLYEQYGERIKLYSVTL